MGKNRRSRGQERSQGQCWECPQEGWEGNHQVVSAAEASDQQVILFYSNNIGKPWREFSNFWYDDKIGPFEFELPKYARPEGFPQRVSCEFSEKAIMLVKAAMMGDKESFQNIANAKVPAEAKRLGRRVRNFDEKLWKRRLETTANQVVLQKFSSSAELKKVLLATGDAILAEAAASDSIWGIGLPASDARARDPKQWPGSNILGSALMRARETLRGNRPSGTLEEGDEGADVDANTEPDGEASEESQKLQQELSLTDPDRKEEDQEPLEAGFAPPPPSAKQRRWGKSKT